MVSKHYEARTLLSGVQEEGWLTRACTRLRYLARFQRFHAHCSYLCSEGSCHATAQRVKPGRWAAFAETLPVHYNSGVAAFENSTRSEWVSKT
jgi:hypothetical protein